MRRLLTVSLLFTLAVFATAIGQQPKTDPAPKAGDKKSDKNPADLTAAAIAAALANDPDVRMAKAKIQLAEAELAKARQVVALKVVALKGKRDQLKAEARTAEARVANVTKLMQMKVVSLQELGLERDKLDAATAALAAAEAEWKLLTSGGAGVGLERIPGEPDDRTIATALDWLARHAADKADPATAQSSLEMLKFIAAGYQAYQAKHAVKGPIPERLRVTLDKPVKLGAKGEKITFEKALEVFKKEAGFDVPVRGESPLVGVSDPKTGEFTSRPIEIVSQGEELPVGAWLQLIEDKATVPHLGNGQPIHHHFYVREYGLFFSDTRSAPPDAPTLTEFWKHKPPAKEPKPK